jgi:PPOX class probable F420-dependent enzyme
MGALSERELHDFLQGRYIASLATLNDDGSIQLTAVWYLFDEGKFYVAIESSSRKARNVLARPKASIMVDARRTQPEKGVTAICAVEVLRGDEARPFSRRLLSRYLSEAAMADPKAGGMMEGLSDIVLRLVPQRWIAWDNAELDAQVLDGVFRRNPGYLLPTD